MVSVFGYGPRNMAMLSSLRSIAMVATVRAKVYDGSLRPELAISPTERSELGGKPGREGDQIS